MSQTSTVIGCGVSGLSTGIRLLEAGFEVTIIAKDLPPATTSDTAAAIWYPYRCFPEEKALYWGKETLETFYRMARIQETGISAVTFTEYLPEKTSDPWWKDAVKNFHRISMENLPSLYKDGYRFEVPFVDTSIYMPWLVHRFNELGGKIRKAELRTLEEVDGIADIIVNCSGAGAKSLVGDETVYPVKGQSVRVKGTNNGGYYLDQYGDLALCYVLPRKNDIVLGGTAVVNDDSSRPDDRATKEILRKAKLLDPSLQIEEVTDVSVGLRPARPEVRLEALQRNNTRIIHNYGHGGAGFTLSWGCADEVVELVKKTLIE